MPSTPTQHVIAVLRDTNTDLNRKAKGNSLSCQVRFSHRSNPSSTFNLRHRLRFDRVASWFSDTRHIYIHYFSNKHRPHLPVCMVAIQSKRRKYAGCLFSFVFRSGFPSHFVRRRHAAITRLLRDVMLID